MKPFQYLLVCALLANTLLACKTSAPESAGSDTKAEDQSTIETDQKSPTDPASVEVPEIPAPNDVSAVPDDAEKSKSGLAWKVLMPGEGDKRPDRHDIVTLNYTGWTPDGRMFLTSQKPLSKRRGKLEDFMPSWIEGVQLMLPGEKRRFWVPGKLAYGELDEEKAQGDANADPEKPRGRVVFDIELVEFKRGPRPPRETPEDVAAVPPNAERSKTGLAWRVLEKGTGKKHPKPDSRVFVHYAGWTTDGKMFDTSLALGGRPASFVVKEASMAGWREVIPMMVPGEVRRVWVPESLALPDQPAFPKGMVVYDIHLIDFED